MTEREELLKPVTPVEIAEFMRAFQYTPEQRKLLRRMAIQLEVTGERLAELESSSRSPGCSAADDLESLHKKMGKFGLDELLMIVKEHAELEDECAIASRLEDMHRELTSR